MRKSGGDSYYHYPFLVFGEYMLYKIKVAFSDMEQENLHSFISTIKLKIWNKNWWRVRKLTSVQYHEVKCKTITTHTVWKKFVFPPHIQLQDNARSGKPQTCTAVCTWGRLTYAHVMSSRQSCQPVGSCVGNRPQIAQYCWDAETLIK